MKKMKYGIAVTCLTVGMMLAITACGGKKAESTETAAQTAVVVETQTETETAQESELTLADGQMFSYLTGEPVDEKIGLQRPYAIMINNIKEGLPQSGVSQAEMIYEAQVEGGITRLMALFQDVDHVEKIGSIRSARHYYIDYHFYYYKMTLYHEQTIPVFLTGYMLLFDRDVHLYYQYHNNHQIQSQAYRMSAAYHIPHPF